GTVAAQPENTIDPPQVEALGNAVVFSEPPRRDRYGTRWCPVLRGRTPAVSLRLVKKLKPEMWTKFERAQRQAQFHRSLMDLCSGGPSCITKIADGNLLGLKERRRL